MLEGLAGKRQGNRLAATITNIDRVKEAYETAEHASGSAEREQMNWSNSVQYSIDQLKASLQELANDILSSQLLKSIVNVGNEGIKTLDKLANHPLIAALLGGGVLGTIIANKNYGGLQGLFSSFANANMATGASNFMNNMGNKSGFSQLFNGLAEASSGGKGSIKDFLFNPQADIKALEKYNDDILAGVDATKAMTDAVKGQNLVTRNLITNANGAVVSQEILTKVENHEAIAAEAATFATRMLSAALMSIGIGIAIGAIAAIATEMQKMAERADRAKDAASEFSEEVANLKSKVSENKKAISDLSDEYAELSKGVTDSGQNVSLSADQYDRYKEIVSELSEIMPNLETYFNGQGEAIGFVQGKLDDLNKSYDQYIHNEAQKLLNEENDEGENKAELTEENYRNTFEYGTINDDMGFFDLFNAQKNNQGNTATYTSQQKYLKWLKDFVGKTREEQIEILKHPKDSSEWGYQDLLEYNFGESADDIINDIENNNKEFTSKMEGIISEQDAQISTAFESEKDLLMAYYQASSDYTSLSEDTKNNVEQFINNLNNDTLQGIDFKDLGLDENDTQAYIERVIDEFNTNEDLQDVYTKLGNIKISDESYSEFQADLTQWAETLKTVLGLDDEGVKQILLQFGLDQDSLETNSNALQTFFQNKGLSSKDASEIVGSMSVEEINTFGTQSGMEELGGALSGTEKSMDDFNRSITTYRKNAYDAAKASEKYSDSLVTIDKSINNLDSLDSVYADVIDGMDEFDYSALYDEDFVKKFATNQEVYEEFIDTIGNTTNVQDAQQAFDDLATAALYSSDAFDKLNENTKNVWINNAEQSGVTNAEEVANSYLRASNAYEQMKDQYANTAQARILANQSLQEADADLIGQIYHTDEVLEKENFTLDESAQYILGYKTQVEIATGTVLDTSGSINNLIALAQQCNITGEALNSLYAMGKLAQTSGYKNNPNRVYKTTNNKASEILKSYGYSDKQVQDMIVGHTPAQVYEMLRHDGQTEDVINKVRKNLSSMNFAPAVKYGGGSASNKARSGGSGGGSSNNGGSGGGGNDTEPEETEEVLDWIETKISRIQRDIDNLNKTVSASYKTWGERLGAISPEMNKITEQIGAQEQAYGRYIQQVQSVGLAEEWASKVRDGVIDINTITDETLKQQISDYKQWYEKALEASDAIEDLRSSLADLAKTRFDDIANQFDEIISRITHTSDVIQKMIDKTEAEGYIVGQTFYRNLINIENQNLSQLESKLVSLRQAQAEAVSSGNVAKDSEAWYEMQDAIDEVESSIYDAKKALVEYKNELRQIEWDLFDKTQDYISQITDESDWIQELIKDENKITDKDTGRLNNYGRAVGGLMAVDYDTYMRQAQEYADEVAKINRELSKDPYNNTLIERRNELIKSQREMISAAEDEKKAIHDLIEESYNAMLDVLQKLIDKRKDALSAEKDLYDYQNTVKEQTDNIASIRKQIMSLSGDDSEETRAKMQTLNTNLKEAEKSLEETEYDQWISDQQQLMDDMYTEIEEWLNTRLDDLDGLVQEMIDTTNNNSTSIENTITTETGNVGYTITTEMQNIWNNTNAVVTNFQTDFDNRMVSVLNVINSINSLTKQMLDQANQRAAAEAAAQQAAAQAAAAAAQPAPAPAPAPQPAPAPASNPGGFFIYKEDHYPKNRLRTESSIVDRLKSHNFDSSMSARRMYYEAMGLGSAGSYTGSSGQNMAMLNWINNIVQYKCPKLRETP